MQYIKRITLLVICSFLLGYPISLTKRDSESMNGCSSSVYAQMTNYYHEKKNSIDVLVLGDSNLYRGFNPLRLWQKEHVTSYVLASPTQPAWLSYYVLEDALHSQKPKVVVFEINELFAKATGHVGRNCTVINSIKSDTTHLKAIQNSEGGFEDDDRDILYKTYAKHTLNNSLKSITHEKRKQSTTNNKGYYLNTTVIPMLSGSSYMARYDVNLNVDEDNQKQIDKIINLCKKEGIAIVFVKLPTKEWTSQKSDLAKQYAKERDIPLLDMNTDIDIIDWSKDTKDNGFHMNDYGASKVSDALTSFLKAHITLSPTDDQEVIDNYNKAYKRYKKLRKEHIDSNDTTDIK